MKKMYNKEKQILIRAHDDVFGSLYYISKKNKYG